MTIQFTNIVSQRYLLLFEIIIIIIIITNVYVYKYLILYLICVISIAITASTILFRSNKYVIIINSIILFTTLRLIFFVGTKFNILPFIDTYWELSVVRIFLDEEKVFNIVDEKGGISSIEGYSAWPILHMFNIIGIKITNINPFFIHMFNLVYIPFIPFIFTIILIYLIYKKSSLPSQFIYISSIFYATSPDIIYWSLQLIRNTYAWTLISILIFLIFKNEIKPSRSNILLIFFLLMVIVLTHHWSSIIISITLALIYFTNKAITYTKLSRFFFYIKTPYLIFLFVALIILIIWWINFAPVIFEMIDFANVISIRPNPDRWIPTFPSILTPELLISLLRIKTLLIFIPAIIGLFFIYKNRSLPLFNNILLFYIIGLLLFLFNFIINLEPTRIIVLFVPFLLIALSLTYVKLYNKSSHIFFFLISFIIISSFIGIFSHSIAPQHLYNHVVNPLEIGEHSIYAHYIKEFLYDKIDCSKTDVIFTDDLEASTILVKTPCLLKLDLLPFVPSAELFNINNINNNYIISTKEFLLYRYAAGGLSDISYSEALNIKEMYKLNINKLNKIYYDGYSSLYK